MMTNFEIHHPFEAAITTDLREPPYNFTLWDTETETQLVTFKGEKSCPTANSLQLLDSRHIITAHDNLIRVWSIANRLRLEQKLFLPYRPSALAVTPCGNYLIVGRQETINIWQLHSGNLLTSIQKHYQSISVIKVCIDSSFIVTGGDDGLVFVWSLADLICGTRNVARLNQDQQQATAQDEPRYSWQHHSSQVTAIHLTAEGKNGRCITTSVDETVNIYSMINGKRLANIMMPTPIWSVTMNRKGTFAYLGGQTGDIYEIATNSLGFSLTSASSKPTEPIYTGHKGKVTCLEISIDGRRLISSSLDSTCKIWSTETKKLIRDVKHQGPVVNLKLLLIPDSLAISSQSKTDQPLPIKSLRRAVYKTPSDSVINAADLFSEEHVIYVKNDKEIEEILKPEGFIHAKNPSTLNGDQNDSLDTSDRSETSKSNDVSKIASLKKTIKDLYLLAADKIFKDAGREALKPYAIDSNDDTPSQTNKRRRLSSG